MLQVSHTFFFPSSAFAVISYSEYSGNASVASCAQCVAPPQRGLVITPLEKTTRRPGAATLA